MASITSRSNEKETILRGIGSNMAIPEGNRSRSGASRWLARDLRPCRRRYRCSPVAYPALLLLGAMLQVVRAGIPPLIHGVAVTNPITDKPTTHPPLPPDERDALITIEFIVDNIDDCRKLSVRVPPKRRKVYYAEMLATTQLFASAHLVALRIQAQLERFHDPTVVTPVLLDRGCHRMGYGQHRYVFHETFLFSIDIPPPCANVAEYRERPLAEQKRPVAAWRLLQLINRKHCPKQVLGILENLRRQNTIVRMYAGPYRDAKKRTFPDDGSGSNEDDEDLAEGSGGNDTETASASGDDSPIQDLATTYMDIEVPAARHDNVIDDAQLCPNHTWVELHDRDDDAQWLNCFMTTTSNITTCDRHLVYPPEPKQCGPRPPAETESPTTVSMTPPITSSGGVDSGVGHGGLVNHSGELHLDSGWVACCHIASSLHNRNCSKYNCAATDGVLLLTEPAAESTNGPATDGIRMEMWIVVAVAVMVIALTTLGAGLMCYNARHRLPVRRPKKGTESEEQTVDGDELENGRRRDVSPAILHVTMPGSNHDNTSKKKMKTATTNSKSKIVFV